jgi:hypothetical protein
LGGIGIRCTTAGCAISHGRRTRLPVPCRHCIPFEPPLGGSERNCLLGIVPAGKRHPREMFAERSLQQRQARATTDEEYGAEIGGLGSCSVYKVCEKPDCR